MYAQREVLIKELKYMILFTSMKKIPFGIRSNFIHISFYIQYDLRIIAYESRKIQYTTR